MVVLNVGKFSGLWVANVRNKLGLSSAKLRNSQFSALTLLESKKGLVVLLAALSMTISNIFFEGGGGERFGKSEFIFLLSLTVAA